MQSITTIISINCTVKRKVQFHWDRWFDSDAIHKHYFKMAAIMKTENWLNAQGKYMFKYSIKSSPAKGIIFCIMTGHAHNLPETSRAEQYSCHVTQCIGNSYTTTSRRPGQLSRGQANWIIKEDHMPVCMSFYCLLKASRKENSRAKWRGWHRMQVPALEMMPMSTFLMLKRLLAWCKALYLFISTLRNSSCSSSLFHHHLFHHQTGSQK